ncbi:conjugal transfer protein TrbE [Phenylobacterium sp. 58.2.17]|jgi:type IV secretion system protein TrbE|uniref:conjugal transfer protein TrbE n=1 Tax=Phenylobacterium sp. 58.2.17 TaxID=2969306 RepID=UPI00226405C2|nr:conjugal transfer protein TrbE [Phenylobacterium sp. 58.2.17]MCX7586305.1 conjugal transfer protein TrbE [Phenylobacterium sp. 58.2.17]
MMSLREYQRRPARLADYLPWAALVAPGVVLNKDGSFQRAARFRGPDLDSVTEAELASSAARLNAVLRRLGSGWAIFVEARRDPAQDYPQSSFPDPVSGLIDAERRAAFEAEGAHFDSRFYLTFLHLPPAEGGRRVEGWLYEGLPAAGEDWRGQLTTFIDQTDRILALLEGLLPELNWLDDGETLSFLHGAVSTGRQRVRVPETPMHLDVLLADQPLAGGLAPRLGASHLRVLTINGFPSATWPGLLDDLNRLAFPYRWTTRAICLDKLDAAKLLSKIRRQWFAKRKSLAAILKEVLTNEASALIDTDAENKSQDADAALQDLGADAAGHAFVTASVVVWDEDAGIADARLRLVEKALQARDFTCVLERGNAVDAWLGSLPGHAYANVRQPPISTLNLAHMIPVSAVWAGPERNQHLNAPPLLLASTQGCTPFRFSPHVGDVGHTLVLGPTGAGKSVLLALMALQFRRYRNAQTFAFDFGGSMRAATLGVGGAYHDLGVALAGEEGAAVSLQPLASCDDLDERAWAADWLAALMARENVMLDPEDRGRIWSALSNLGGAPAAERTLSGLAALLQSAKLKHALAPYTLAGPWGGLLDGDHEHLGAASATCFETEGLIGASAAPATLSYLFHRIRDRLDGRPTLIFVDEGWLVLDDALFGAQLREWLKTLRKLNAAVVFATQSLADVEASAIAPAIIESCPTRVFLPNDRALEPQIAAAYARFGLNSRQIEIISQATPKRDYYSQSRQGDRLIELGLGDIALAFCAASSKSDQLAISSLLEAHGVAGFPAAWLRHRGLDWAAEWLTPQGSHQPMEVFP